MRLLYVLLVAAATITLALANPIRGSTTASACQLISAPDAKDRLDLRIKESSELAVVGVVLAEFPIESELVTSPTGATVIRTPREARRVYPDDGEYQPTVRV